MNILVTGGAGFIGSHIVDACIEAGHAVSVVDDLSTGRRANVHPRATLHECDLRDHQKLDEIFRARSFDAVSHHAAQIDVRRSVEDPLFDASVNILGTLALLECCAKFHVPKVIFASSGGAIYGEQEYFPADEQHPTCPLSPYGVAKLAVERYLFSYNAIYGMDVVSFRYANVYGPRQNPHGEAGVVAVFLSKMLQGGQPLINGDGTQTRDYVYVDDVVRANIFALDSHGFQILNVATAIETSVNEVFRKLKLKTGCTCDEMRGPAKSGEQMRSILTWRTIKDVFGWSPQVSIDEGLARTAAAFEAAYAHERSASG